ncbi:hypothetical protein RHMOL_Rhmol01G0273300 [Rhododendron molle]|uniref:Uncharacterized protein n=1 Tax=Rhododendron molle TaxID=49168 RepID=A0ACC0Q987_RHOML|nr:hypothetical protein RHMOL_Rhmol01G0273300 [Rhododendron molle]
MVPMGPWSKRPVLVLSLAIVRRNFLASAAGGGGGRIRDDRETIEGGGGGEAEADGGAGETEDAQVPAKNAITSTSNTGKLFRVKQHCMRGDRITILPDSVLIHILSFLPTKYAVRTRILSTRWKHIWASVPNLHFFFMGRHCSVFADFTDRVLFFHELPRIQRFSLECAGVDLNRLNAWVSVAVRRGVQELHIDVQYTSDCILLPPTLFTSTTLVVFKLRSVVQMEIPGLVRFPNLRVLHVSLQYPFGDMIQKLSCSCPVLEDFSIGGRVDNSQAMAFDISTVALKKLEMDFYEDQGFEDSDNEFVINAPILEHLTLRDDYFALYRLKNLSSLFRADIDVGVGCIGFYGSKERANTVYELLKGISNVEYLTLGARTMGALDYADDNNLPLLFPNLTHLKLRVSNSSSWKRLTYLLSCMPNLENLGLEVSTKKDLNFTTI